MLRLLLVTLKSLLWAAIFTAIIKEWYVPLIVFPLNFAVDWWLFGRIHKQCNTATNTYI